MAAIIGGSASSTVYLAMGADGGWVALKVLAFERMGDDRALARFRKECETALEVQHPYLVRVLGADPANRYTPWLAMEVCEGGSLRDWIEANGPMPPFQAIEVMVQVTSALSGAHRLGVAQRRLALADVLLDRAGKCKLFDFRRASTSALTSDSLDLREDLVAAGALLYALLTGREGVIGEMSAVPDALKQVVIKSQARGRGQGYADASAMARDLEAAMLEVSVPSGRIQPLVDADAALPPAFEELVDADETFEDLQRAARWAADPAAGPSRVELDSEEIYRRLGGQAPSEPRPVATASAPRPVMASKVRASQSATGFTRSGVGAPPSSAPPSGASVLPRPAVPAKEPPSVLETPLAPIARSRAAAPFEDSVTPAPASRAQSGFRPSYLADEPEKERDESWRKATPQPVRRTVAPEPTNQIDPRIGLAVVALVVVVILAIFGVGATSVRDARIAAEDAGEVLTAVVEAEASVVNDLVAKGADRALLEGGFFAYKDARGAKRHEAADAFAAALRAETARIGVDVVAPGASHDDVSRRVIEILDAQARYHRERQAWSDTARGFPGALPVLVGVARAP